MEDKPTHEEFGELKNQYSLPKNIGKRESFIPLMRENLIARNGGSTKISLYAESRIVDVMNCDVEDLYAADYSLKSKKGV